MSTKIWSSLPVDGHVHLHSLEAAARALDAAAANFTRASGRREGVVGMLLLTQSRRESVFEQLPDHPPGRWRIEPLADEMQTLVARCADVSIVIVCGRQIQAARGIEVLALGTRQTFQEEMPLLDTIVRVQEAGALPVVPWGLGKWRGERGRAVVAALDSLGPSTVFVGDNGSRLNFLGMPRRIRAIESRGFSVLPGTDPFPIADDYRRIGQFGFRADVERTESRPWLRLSTWLRRLGTSPQVYGEASDPMRFFVNQFGIQVRKRWES